MGAGTRPPIPIKNSGKASASSDDGHEEEQDDNEEDLLKSAHLELIRSTRLYPAAFMQ